jgi:hypothetical protein
VTFIAIKDGIQIFIRTGGQRAPSLSCFITVGPQSKERRRAALGLSRPCPRFCQRRMK